MRVCASSERRSKPIPVGFGRTTTSTDNRCSPRESVTSYRPASGTSTISRPAAKVAVGNALCARFARGAMTHVIPSPERRSPWRLSHVGSRLTLVPARHSTETSRPSRRNARAHCRVIHGSATRRRLSVETSVEGTQETAKRRRSSAPFHAQATSAVP